MRTRWFSRKRDGTVAFAVADWERALLRALVGELTGLVRDDTDPGLVRLYPPGHAEDAATAEEYHRIAHESLRAGRLEAAAHMLSALDAGERGRLDDEAQTAWLRVLNDLRLVLGTRLGVTEDDPDPGVDDDPERALYGLLSAMLDELVEVMAG